MDNIIKLITTYGTGPVCIALMVVISLVLLERFKKTSEEQDSRWANILEIVKNMSLSGKTIENEPKEHSAVEEVKGQQATSCIQKQIDKFRNEVGANRVAIYEFHNGTYSFNGKRSFQKVSLNYESVDDITKPIMKSYQNAPRSFYIEITDGLYANKCLYIDMVDKMENKSNTLYHDLSDRQVEGVMYHAVYDESEGVMIGFISAEFITADVKINETTKFALQGIAQRISGIFEVKRNEEQEE